MPKPKLKLYSVKNKEHMSTTSYGLRKKKTKRGMTYYAIATKNGAKYLRFVKPEFFEKWNRR